MPSGVKADRLKFEHSAAHGSGIGDNLVSTLILSDDHLSDFRDLLENIDVQNTLIFFKETALCLFIIVLYFVFLIISLMFCFHHFDLIILL